MTRYRFEVRYHIVVPGEVEAFSQRDARERIERRDPSLMMFDAECRDFQLVKLRCLDE